MHDIEIMRAQVGRELPARGPARRPFPQSVGERLRERAYAVQSARLAMQSAAARRGDVHLMPASQPARERRDVRGVPAAIAFVEIGVQELQTVSAS